jgi:hypothetical protein
LPAYVTKILSVTYYANCGLSCPEWQFNVTGFRDARLDHFSCRFGSRSEFTDTVKRLTRCTCLRVGDVLGCVYQDKQFASLFPRRGQPLMDAVADPTQRRKGTSGDHGFVELMMPRLCRFPVDCAFSVLAYVPFIKGGAGDHTVSPGVISMERGKPDGFALNNLPRCTQVLQFFKGFSSGTRIPRCARCSTKPSAASLAKASRMGPRSDVVSGQQLSHFQLCARRPCS